MATPIDPATNLALAQQLLTVMADITAQMDKQGKLLQTQNQLFEALCKSQKCVDGSNVRDLTTAAKEAQEQLDRTTTTSTKLGEALEKVTNWAKKLSVPAEFLKGFKDGLNLSTNVFKNIMSLGGTALGMIKEIGMTILSLPGKLFDLFNTGGGGADPYRQQLEKLRGEFGNLQVGTSKAILGMMPHMKDFEKSGLRLSRVFGYGREGLAKQLEELQKIASELGGVGRMFAEAARDVSGLAMVLSKSGLGVDAFRSLTAASLNGGETVAKALDGMVKDVAIAEKTFGISSRELQKDVTEISKNFATFGPVARGVMLATSAYVKKLGITIESLKKVADKSFNFEDAAEQAAKLGEAFNMALDPMKMMKANPAEKLDMIRQAFFKTGKNIEQMTVQERNYLAATAGVSEEESRLVFAQKNRSLSNAQLQDQMKKGQKTPITQAEAMNTLAKSIERLVLSGGTKFTGFLDAFFKGFERGIRRTKEFRAVVIALRGALKQVWLGGIQVGRMFVDQFPGIKTMLKALAEMFNPARFRELMAKVIGEFRRLFQAIQTDPRAGIKVFMANMKKIFFDFFNKGAPAGGRFLDGLKMFFKTVGVIFIEGLKYAFESLRDVLKFVIETIKDPSKLKAGAMEVGSGLAGMFQQAFQYLVTELGPVINEIGPQIVELLTLVFEKYIKPHLMHLLGALLGPALFFGVARAVGTVLIQTVFMGVFARMMRVVPTPPPITGNGPTPPPAAMAGSLKNFGVTLVKIAAVMIVIAATVRILMPLIIGIAKSIDKSKVSAASLVATVGLLILIGGFFVAIGYMIKVLSPIVKEPVPWSALMKYLGLIAGVMIVIALTAAAIIAIIAGVPVASIQSAALAISLFGILFLAVGGLVQELAIMANQGLKGSPGGLALFVGIIVVTLGLIALAARAAVWLFKEVPADQVMAAAMAVGTFGLLFFGIGSLIIALGGESPAALAVSAGAMLLMLVISAVVVAIGLAAAAAVKAIGNTPMDQVLTTALAVGTFGLLFFGIGSLIIALGAASGPGLASAGPAALYMVVIAATLIGIAVIAKVAIGVFGQIPMSEILTTFAAIGSFVILFGAIGLLIVFMGVQGTLALASGAVGMALGYMAVIVVTLAAISYGAYQAIKLFGSFQLSQVTVTVLAIGAAVGMFIATGLVLALLIHEIGKVSTVALAQAVIMLVALLWAVGKLAEMAVKIMEQTSRIKISEDSAKGVTAIIDSVVKMMLGVAAAMAVLVAMTRSSVMGALFGFDFGNVQSQFRDIKDMMFGADGRGGIMGALKVIIVDFIRTISDMKGDAAELTAKAKFFSTIVEGISALITPFTNLVEVVVSGNTDSLSGALTGLSGQTILNAIQTSLTNFLDGMFKDPTGIIPLLINKFENMSTSQGEALKLGGEVLKNILPGIAGIAQVFPTLIGEMTKLSDEMPDNQFLQAMGIAKAMIIETIDHVSTLVTAMIGGLIPLLSNPSITPEKLQAAKGIGEIFSGIGSLAKAIIPSPEVIKSLKDVTYAADGSQTITEMQPMITRYMDNMISSISTLVNGSGATSGGIKGLIAAVAETLTGLTPSQIENLKIIAPILQAIGNLFGAIMPSTEILQKITGQAGTSATIITNRMNIEKFILNSINMFTSLLGSIKTFVGELAPIVGSLNASSIEGLKALGPIMDAIGNLFKTILMPSGKVLEAILAVPATGTADTGNAAKINKFMNDMRYHLNALFFGEPVGTGGIKAMIVDLITSLNDMGLTETKIKGLNVIAPIVTAIAGIVGSLVTAMGSVTANIQGGSGASFQIGTQISAVIGSMTTAISQIFEKIPELVGLLVHMDFGRGGTRGLNAKVAALKSLFEFIGQVATVAASLKGDVPSGGGARAFVNIYTEIFSPVMQLLSYIFGGDQTVSGVGGSVSLQRIINSISALRNISGLKERVVVLKSLFEAIGVMAATVKDLKEKFTPAAGGSAVAITANDLQPGFLSIKNTLDAFQDGGSAAFLAKIHVDNIDKAHGKLVGSHNSGIAFKIKGIADALGSGSDGMLGSMTRLKDSTANFSRDFPLGTPTFENFGRIKDVTNSLIEQMNTLATEIETGNGNGNKIQRILDTFGGHGFIAKVRTAIQTYNAFSNELAGLRGGNVAVTLNALNSSLVGARRQDFGNATARIAVNVNVRLDAANLSRVLYSYSTEGSQASHAQGNTGPLYSVRENSFNGPHSS